MLRRNQAYLRNKPRQEEFDEEEGIRILVMRRWPMMVPKKRVDYWWKVLAPSRELLSRYKSESLSWDAFEMAYTMQIINDEGAMQGVYRIIEFLQRGKTVTLLCSEKQYNSNCHVYPLMDIIAHIMATEYLEGPRIPQFKGKLGSHVKPFAFEDWLDTEKKRIVLKYHLQETLAVEWNEEKGVHETVDKPDNFVEWIPSGTKMAVLRMVELT